MLPTKLLAFAFYQLRELFKILRDDRFSDFKALSIILFTESCLLLDTLAVASILAGHLFVPRTTGTNIIGYVFVLVCLADINYRLLKRNDNWSRFKQEFDAYPWWGRVLGRLAVGSVVIGSFLAVLILGTFTRTLARA